MIKYLTFSGKKHPIRVSYYALKMLKAEINKTLTELSDDDFEAQEILLYYALQRGAKVTGKEFTLKKEDMEDVMDEVYLDFMRVIPEFFPAAQAFAGEKKSVEKK